jgi:hypothetical protein
MTIFVNVFTEENPHLRDVPPLMLYRGGCLKNVVSVKQFLDAHS